MAAYGAVICLRIIKNGQVFISMQLAKSKVASLQGFRIPRLELCAALVLARLSHHFVRIMRDAINALHLWSDSQDVLWYLTEHPLKWEAFIANRCAEILELMPTA